MSHIRGKEFVFLRGKKLESVHPSGVYSAFLDVGLKFPLDDDDPMALLVHYGLPFYRHSSLAIRALILFLSLICCLGIPFSVNLFCFMCMLSVLRGRGGGVSASIIAWMGCKIVYNAQNKVHQWRNKFMLMGLPIDFSLLGTWTLDDPHNDRCRS